MNDSPVPVLHHLKPLLDKSQPAGETAAAGSSGIPAGAAAAGIAGGAVVGGVAGTAVGSAANKETGSEVFPAEVQAPGTPTQTEVGVSSSWHCRECLGLVSL